MTARDLHPRAPSGGAGKGLRRAWTAALALAATASLAIVPGTGAQSPPAGSSLGAITVTDDARAHVVIPAVPHRVVSLSPAITETVFALGAGDRLVGGTDADDYPAGAAALPDVVSQTKVLTERIVSLEPDLVLAGGNGLTPQADIDQLRSLGYPVVSVYARTVDGVLDDIRLIGRVLGGDADATAGGMSSSMDADLGRIAEVAARASTRPRTLYEIYYGPDVYAPADDSFVQDLVVFAGGDAITTGDPAVFSLPLERLVVADPEVIVLGDAAYGVCPDIVAARPGWAGIRAVRDGAIRPVNDTVITRPGPRLAEGLASLTRAVHPELADELADFPADPPMCQPVAASTAPASSGP